MNDVKVHEIGGKDVLAFTLEPCGPIVGQGRATGNDTGSQMPIGRAAEIAADNGITVHAIAMGDPATVGEEALDLPVLTGIAEQTGGRFFLALDRGQLESVYDELDRVEPVVVETLSYQPSRKLFHYPLGVAALLIGLLSLHMLLSGPPRARHEHA